MLRLKFKTYGGSDLLGVFFTTFSIFAFGVRCADDAAALNTLKSDMGIDPTNLNLHSIVKCQLTSNTFDHLKGSRGFYNAGLLGAVMDRTESTLIRSSHINNA